MAQETKQQQKTEFTGVDYATVMQDLGNLSAALIKVAEHGYAVLAVHDKPLNLVAAFGDMAPLLVELTSTMNHHNYALRMESGCWDKMRPHDMPVRAKIMTAAVEQHLAGCKSHRPGRVQRHFALNSAAGRYIRRSIDRKLKNKLVMPPPPSPSP